MSGKYLVARDAFGNGSLSWSEDKIYARLVSGAYHFDETHADISELNGVVGDPVLITGARFENGWARLDPLLFTQVKGALVIAFVVYAGDGRLIEYHDAVQYFPMTPNGGDIRIKILEPGLFRI